MAKSENNTIIALTLEDDLKLGRFYLSFKDTGLNYITFYSEDESYIHGKCIYRIINEKKFKFACIKTGIIPEFFNKKISQL